MNSEKVGKKLVELCRKGEWMQAIDSLYGKDIVSVEAQGMGEESINCPLYPVTRRNWKVEIAPRLHN
jgi:hypothetical protein